jgi:hypothetical protein
MKRVDRRKISSSVHKGWAEMALKRFHYALCPVTKFTCHFNAVAVERKHRLQRFHRLPVVASLKKAATADLRWRDPVPDTVKIQLLPGEIFARIDLANRGYVGVSEHPFRRDGPARATISTQFGNGFYLDIRKWR